MGLIKLKSTQFKFCGIFFFCQMFTHLENCQETEANQWAMAQSFFFAQNLSMLQFLRNNSGLFNDRSESISYITG